MFVCPVGERGGAESTLFTLWQRLDRASVEASVFFLRDGPFVKEVRQLGLPVWVEPIPRLMAPISYARAVAAIRRAALEVRADAVVSSLGYAHLFGGVAARLAGLRAVWWDHALATRGQWLDRWVATFPTDLVITDSVRAMEAHRQMYPECKTRVVHPGLDLSEWRAASRTVSGTLLTELGLSPGSLVITCVGRLEAGKGQDLLIRAAAEIVPSFPAMRILLVGGPAGNGTSSFAGDLRRMTGELGLSNHVTFVGATREIKRILEATDVFVHPARYPESFGVAVLEAMASGKPIVATRVGGPEEILGESGAGIVVDPGDSRALAGAIRALVESDRLRADMGRRASLRAESFEAGRMVAAFDRALDDLFGRRGNATHAD